jgi:hypothetical protein
MKWGQIAVAFAVAFILLGWGIEWLFGESLFDPRTGGSKPGAMGEAFEVVMGLAFFVFPVLIPAGLLAVCVGWVLRCTGADPKEERDSLDDDAES